MDEDEKFAVKVGCGTCLFAIAGFLVFWAAIVYGIILIIRAFTG